jgi:hypothetical protein
MTWSATKDFSGWLGSLGLEQYEAAFRENAIDPTILLRLTAEDLKDLGVVFYPWSNRELVEQESAELWPLLWPPGAALDALCTLGARPTRGVKRLLFVSFSHF